MGAVEGCRNLFRVRAERSWAPRGPLPQIGARVCRQDIRFVVQAGLGHEMWEWLQDRGFREITYSPDRRRYRDLPPLLVTRLYGAPREQWRSLLTRAIEEAAKRSPVNAGARSVRLG